MKRRQLRKIHGRYYFVFTYPCKNDYSACACAEKFVILRIQKNNQNMKKVDPGVVLRILNNYFQSPKHEFYRGRSVRGFGPRGCVTWPVSYKSFFAELLDRELEKIRTEARLAMELNGLEEKYGTKKK